MHGPNQAPGLKSGSLQHKIGLDASLRLVCGPRKLKQNSQENTAEGVGGDGGTFFESPILARRKTAKKNEGSVKNGSYKLALKPILGGEG